MQISLFVRNPILLDLTSLSYLAMQALENTNVSNSDEITVLKIIRPKLDSRRDIFCHNMTKITL